MKKIKVAPIKPVISSDVLDKVDIRVGTIELVEDVQGSDKREVYPGALGVTPLRK